MKSGSLSSQQSLDAIVRASPALMHALRLVRDCLPGAYIGAGAVRSVVWDYLHGYRAATPVADVDVIHFSREDGASDGTLRARLAHCGPGIEWEVTNQATVHLWYERCFGVKAAAFGSLDEAVASWPETATAVAVRLRADGQFDIIAPFGLDDLLGMVVRFNPARATHAHYLARVEQKQFQKSWPRVRVVS